MVASAGTNTAEALRKFLLEIRIPIFSEPLET
jgi:hypothetical protein